MASAPTIRTVFVDECRLKPGDYVRIEVRPEGLAFRAEAPHPIGPLIPVNPPIGPNRPGSARGRGIMRAGSLPLRR